MSQDTLFDLPPDAPRPRPTASTATPVPARQVRPVARSVPIGLPRVPEQRPTFRAQDFVIVDFSLPTILQPWLHDIYVGVIDDPGTDPAQWNGRNSEADFCAQADRIPVIVNGVRQHVEVENLVPIDQEVAKLDWRGKIRTVLGEIAHYRSERAFRHIERAPEVHVGPPRDDVLSAGKRVLDIGSIPRPSHPREQCFSVGTILDEGLQGSRSGVHAAKALLTVSFGDGLPPRNVEARDLMPITAAETRLGHDEMAARFLGVVAAHKLGIEPSFKELSARDTVSDGFALK